MFRPPGSGPSSGHKSIYSRKLYSIIIKYINLKFNEISNFRLIYFMSYTVELPPINNFVTWRWPRAGAETCRQFKIKRTNKFSCVLTHLNPSLYCASRKFPVATYRGGHLEPIYDVTIQKSKYISYGCSLLKHDHNIIFNEQSWY